MNFLRPLVIAAALAAVPFVASAQSPTTNPPAGAMPSVQNKNATPSGKDEAPTSVKPPDDATSSGTTKSSATGRAQRPKGKDQPATGDVPTYPQPTEAGKPTK